MRKVKYAGLVAYVIILVSAPAMLGAPRWSPPVLVAAPNSSTANDLQTTTDGRGDTVAVWLDFDRVVIQSATRSAATGRWSPAVDISPPGEYSTRPRIIQNDTGDVTVVWQRQSVRPAPGVRRIQRILTATRSAATGGWSPATDLFPDVAPEQSVPEVSMVIDAQGRAIAAWTTTALRTYPFNQSYVLTRSRASVSDGWGPTVTVADLLSTNVSYDSQLPLLVVDPEGNATVAWSVRTKPQLVSQYDALSIQSSHRSITTGAWNDPFDVTVASHQVVDESAKLVVDRQGTFTLIWSRGDLAGSTPSQIQTSARRRGAGTWEQPVVLAVATGTNVPFGEPQIVASAHGETVAMWTARTRVSADVIYSGIVTATRRPGQMFWDPPQNVSAPGRFSEGSFLAIGPDGTALVAFLDADVAREVITPVSTRRDPVTGTWDTPAPAPQNGPLTVGPLTLNQAGVATMVWQGSRTSESEIYSSSLEDSPSAGPPNAGPTGTPAVVPLTLANTTVRCVKPGRPGTCRVRLSATLSRAATITVTIRRVSNGKQIGTLTFGGAAGANTFVLPKRIGKHTLRDVRYRFAIRAAATDGASSTKTVSTLKLR